MVNIARSRVERGIECDLISVEGTAPWRCGELEGRFRWPLIVVSSYYAEAA